MKQAILLIVIYCGVLVPSAGVINYVNRKFAADLQARVGPNRAGPAGMLQPLADFLKAIQKEFDSESLTFWQSVLFWIQSVALYSTIAILPMGSLILTVDTDMGVFLAFWAALVMALMGLFLGLEQGTVPAWLSAVRLAVQGVAGTFPAVLALFCAGMQAGGLRWSQLIAAQGASPLSWMICRNPFEWLAFLVFVVSGMVLYSVAPMDSGLSRPDILGGISSPLLGRRRALFSFGRFYGFFLWCVIASALFLGGWSIPESVRDSLMDSGSSTVVVALELITVLMKSYLLMIAANLIAKVNPRGRVDQITDFSWKVLSPAALATVILSALWVSGRQLW
jgi:NADH-quinone oxidoreductase subunit H